MMELNKWGEETTLNRKIPKKKCGRNEGNRNSPSEPHSLRCYRQRVQMGANGPGQHFKEKQDM